MTGATWGTVQHRLLGLPRELWHPWAFLLAGASVACGCAGAGDAPRTPEPPSAAVPRARARAAGPPVELAFVALDGTVVTTEALRHRLTVIGLLASYDQASQDQALYLRALATRYRPRINVVILVLEPPDHRPLVEAFAQVLDAPFPVVLADAATVAGRGPFGDLRVVPSVVVLDRQGREAWRHTGGVDLQGLVSVLRSVDVPAPTAEAE